MKITIPEIPPSLNKYAGRANAWDYRAEKQRWLQLFVAYCPKCKPMCKAIVTICLCFHTAAIYAGCSILISKEVLLRFVYGVLIHINYTFQTASRADHCDPRGFVQEEIMKKM